MRSEPHTTEDPVAQLVTALDTSRNQCNHPKLAPRPRGETLPPRSHRPTRSYKLYKAYSLYNREGSAVQKEPNISPQNNTGRQKHAQTTDRVHITEINTARDGPRASIHTPTRLDNSGIMPPEQDHQRHESVGKVDGIRATNKEKETPNYLVTTPPLEEIRETLTIRLF